MTQTYEFLLLNVNHQVNTVFQNDHLSTKYDKNILASF